MVPVGAQQDGRTVGGWERVTFGTRNPVEQWFAIFTQSRGLNGSMHDGLQCTSGDRVVVVPGIRGIVHRKEGLSKLTSSIHLSKNL